jgi:transcription initiation factor IIE alpha subunit
MPFCPVCLSEFREGFTHCNSCDVDLVDQLPEEMDLSEENIRQALEGKELVPVTRGDLEVVKETRDLLSKNRLASIIVDDDQEPAHPGAPKRVVLVVNGDDLEKAVKLLGDKFQKMVKQEGHEVDELVYDVCPACQTKVPENTEECPECGLFVGKA